MTNRHQSVKFGNIFSEWRTLKGAVPQGSVLGALGFIWLLNDLKTKCSIWKFMDDTTLSEIIVDGITEMQNHLNHIKIWSDNNRMIINPKKTKEMVIDFKRNKTDLQPTAVL